MAHRACRAAASPAARWAGYWQPAAGPAASGEPRPCPCRAPPRGPASRQLPAARERQGAPRQAQRQNRR
eukprot:7431747-Alexandrium_andersonii.AAC.1